MKRSKLQCVLDALSGGMAVLVLAARSRPRASRGCSAS